MINCYGRQTIDLLVSPPILSTTVEMPGRLKIMPMNGTRRRKETAAGMKPLLGVMASVSC